MRRRQFLKTAAAGAVVAVLACDKESQGYIMTVRGPIAPEQLGRTLPHEHILVDFIGADKAGPHRYDADKVFQTMLPYLEMINRMLDLGFEKQLLLSQDRGWYRVGEPGGGKVKPYSYFFGEFVPAMKKAGFDTDTVKQLTVTNPANAFKMDTL